MQQLRRKLSHVLPSLRAILALWREEYSFRVQVALAVAVVFLAWGVRVSQVEWLILLLLIGVVLAVEALNTAIEELCDHVTPDEHPHIGKIKDLGSGASLLIAMAAVLIGFVIFLPPLLSVL